MLSMSSRTHKVRGLSAQQVDSDQAVRGHVDVWESFPHFFLSILPLSGWRRFLQRCGAVGHPADQIILDKTRPEITNNRKY